MLILFYYFLRQSLVDDKKTMLLLIGYGAPESMIQQWYGGKLTWLILELVLPTLMVIIGFDFVIKTMIVGGLSLIVTHLSINYVEYPIRKFGAFFINQDDNARKLG